MKNILAVTFAAILLSGIPVSAQTNTFDSLTTSANLETDMEKQVQLLKKALLLAQTPNDKFDANLNIAHTRFKQGIYGEAVYYAGEALNIADADFPNDAERRSRAVVRKSEALRKVGRIDEASALINEDVDRKSLKGDHIWRDTRGGITHRFTAMVCPDFAGQLPRQEFHNFSQAGVDVGCSYKLISEHMNAVSLYMTRYDGRVEDIDAIKNGGAALLNRLPDSKKIAVEQPAKFGSGSGNPVYYTQVGMGSVQRGEEYTGAWTQVIGNWILKTRVTWAAELGVGFGTENSQILFSQNTDNIIANQKSCEALSAPKLGTRHDRDDTLNTIIIAALTGGLAEKLKLDEADGDETERKTSSTAPPIVVPEEPAVTCYAAKSSGDEIVLGYHPAQARRYSTYSAVIDQNFYVESDLLSGLLSKSKKSQFLLKSADDNSVSIYQVYEGEPTPLMVFEDVIDIINGKIASLGSASTEKDGNVNIYINSVSFGAEGKSE